MDLRPYSPTAEDVAELKKQGGYQPYILSDTCQIGSAPAFCHGKTTFVMEQAEVSVKEWQRFVEANARMRRMYDDFIDAICQHVGFQPGMSVLDTAANDGYFLYRFLQRGAGDAVGYDLLDKAPVFAILNRLMGFQARFVQAPYDSTTHRIDGCAPADLVISSAIMCHLSDPLYYLSFLGSVTKKILFLFTSIDPDPTYKIVYDGANYYYKKPFPICFDKLNHVSRGLVDLGLREMGFTRIVEIPYRKNWLPWSFYCQFQALIAMR